MKCLGATKGSHLNQRGNGNDSLMHNSYQEKEQKATVGSSGFGNRGEIIDPHMGGNVIY